MTAPDLSLVPCPCCGRCDLDAEKNWLDGVPYYQWRCNCGAEYDGWDDPSLGSVLDGLLDEPYTGPCDPPPALFVAAVLRGLGLGDDDLRALASGARLEVRR